MMKTLDAFLRMPVVAHGGGLSVSRVKGVMAEGVPASALVSHSFQRLPYAMLHMTEM